MNFNLTMQLSLASRVIAIACLAGALVLSATPALAQPNVPPAGTAAVPAEEGWSFDDIKDVCEAAQFVMIALAIGCLLYWWFFRYIPARNAPQIEFDLEIEQVGASETAWLIEVTAVLKNSGSAPARVSDLTCILKSVDPGESTGSSGALARTTAPSPFFEEKWDPPAFVIDPGTHRRCALAASVARTVNYVAVSATVRHEHRNEPYYASKLARLTGPT